VANHFDCLTCGACCHGDDGWIPVDGRDEPRVSASPELASHLVLIRHGALVRRSLRMVDGACAALRRDGRFVCSIYESRPSTCRELEVGSEGCIAARRSRGVE
jgi:Fe-S-cluster containining protein